jgi:hypothetical protein
VEVCALSREILLLGGSISIPLITSWLSLFPPSLTRYPIGTPYDCLPSREDNGLTTFRVQT